MRLQMMRKIIAAIVVTGFTVPWLILYVYPIEEEKPHFSDRSLKRPKMIELEKLEPGEKKPVFQPVKKSNNKTISLSTNEKDTLNKPKNTGFKDKDGSRGRNYLVADEKDKHQLLKDELPLLSPDWNCWETYDRFQTESYCLPDHDVNHFFFTATNRYCLKEGTAHIIKNNTECYCKPKWYGTYCSMPKVTYESEFPRDTYAHTVADPPRRLINAFPFTQEFHLLEARVHEYEDIVDLYVILESNYTAAGHPRKRLLLERLQSGYLKEYQHKILYVPLGYFPKKAQYNGWVADALLRNHITDEGLNRIKNLQESDIIVLNDADELPVRESLLFLKLHRGYPEPIGFHLVHNVYGFYWRGNDEMSHAFGACSVAMLLHFFHWSLYRLRSASAEMSHNKEDLDHFRYMHSGAVREWSFGNKDKMAPGGWHCSWCFTPRGIKTKLEGAHWSDLPRWGAFPSKTTLGYIHNLTMKGLWFDDRTRLLPAPSKRDPWFAPPYLKQHFEEYRYLLERPNNTLVYDKGVGDKGTNENGGEKEEESRLYKDYLKSVKVIDDLTKKVYNNSRFPT